MSIQKESSNIDEKAPLFLCTLETENETDYDSSPKKQKRVVDYDDTLSLLTELFKYSSQGYWYRILLRDGVFDNVTHATSVGWKYLLPLFLDLGLVWFVITSEVKETYVILTKWHFIQTTVSMQVHMQVSSYQEKK